jgi:CYTH domain-containing protein/CHAD domain-containing protein
MAMTTTTDRSDRLALLPEDARDSARLLALGFHARITASARAVLDAPEHPEAIHALRVAITRLRGTMAAYAEYLRPAASAAGWEPGDDDASRPGGDDAFRPGGDDAGRRCNAVRAVLGRRSAAALQEAHRALGRVRELDVHGELLRSLVASGNVPLAADVARDATRVGAALAAARPAAVRLARRRVQDLLMPRLAPARERLRHFSVPRIAGEPTHAPTLARVLGEALRHGGARLAAQLADAARTGDRRRWHRARLVAKQVRALLAPFDEAAPVLTPLFAQLTQVQDAIGSARDAHRLRRHVRDVAPMAHGLRGALTARRAELEQAMQALATEADALEAAVASAAQWLEAAAPDDVEIERKFLLRALPDRAAAAPSVRITQGWLPGERLQERLRRTVHPDGHVEWTRTVKLGRGIRRVEVEEPATPMLFESLWPLTAAARITKVRHAVPTAGGTWAIDVFLDRPLVLAEIELPSEDAPVTFPDWLAPVVEREVTGDAAYVNANLARTPHPA